MKQTKARTKDKAADPRDSEAASTIRFTATLVQPRAVDDATPRTKGVPWTFLTLPEAASAKLPSRSMVSVAGTLNCTAFQATLQPDGQGGHWLKVDHTLRRAAGAEVGDAVTLKISPMAPHDEPEPEVPPDLRKALAGATPKTREVWADITPIARRDWIFWMTSGKKAETRPLRIAKACDMLAKGKRRACCFDRSGMYDKSLSCPIAQDAPDA